MRCERTRRIALYVVVLAHMAAGWFSDFHLPQLLSNTGVSQAHRLPFEQYAIRHPESQKRVQAQLQTAAAQVSAANPAVLSDRLIFPPPTNHLDGVQVVYKRQCHSSTLAEVSSGTVDPYGDPYH